MIFMEESAKAALALLPMSNRVLALDQSSITTGWSVFEDDKLFEYGHFTLNDKDLGVRLNKFRHKLELLIADYEIDEVIYEDIQLQNNVSNNVQTFKVLAEVIGIIQDQCIEFNIPSSAVLAVVWKSKIGIKGKTRPEQKKNAQQYVIDKYKIKPTQDEADSICIGTYKSQNALDDFFNL